MAQTPALNSVLGKLSRSDLVGVNVHTLAIALDRAEKENIPFDQLSERQIAIALLERASYPESVYELNLFLNTPQTIAANALSLQDVTDQHAPHYMRWIAGFLNDSDQNISRNARLLLRWLIANRSSAIHADQSSLQNLRRVADDESTTAKSSAVIIYALGSAGTTEDDYERVMRHSERVIEHDRENIELVAESLYRFYPPALINALQYFLEQSGETITSKQFSAGVTLLSKVAEIDDRNFWTTYYNEMDKLVAQLNDVAGHISAVERILDLIEKHLALASTEEEDEE